jgi:hypothetical protein
MREGFDGLSLRQDGLKRREIGGLLQELARELVPQIMAPERHALLPGDDREAVGDAGMAVAIAMPEDAPR